MDARNEDDEGEGEGEEGGKEGMLTPGSPGGESLSSRTCLCLAAAVLGPQFEQAKFE